MLFINSLFIGYVVIPLLIFIIIIIVYNYKFIDYNIFFI